MGPLGAIRAVWGSRPSDPSSENPRAASGRTQTGRTGGHPRLSPQNEPGDRIKGAVPRGTSGDTLAVARGLRRGFSRASWRLSPRQPSELSVTREPRTGGRPECRGRNAGVHCWAAEDLPSRRRTGGGVAQRALGRLQDFGAGQTSRVGRGHPGPICHEGRNPGLGIGCMFHVEPAGSNSEQDHPGGGRAGQPSMSSGRFIEALKDSSQEQLGTVPKAGPGSAPGTRTYRTSRPLPHSPRAFQEYLGLHAHPVVWWAVGPDRRRPGRTRRLQASGRAPPIRLPRPLRLPDLRQAWPRRPNSRPDHEGRGGCERRHSSSEDQDICDGNR